MLWFGFGVGKATDDGGRPGGAGREGGALNTLGGRLISAASGGGREGGRETGGDRTPLVLLLPESADPSWVGAGGHARIGGGELTGDSEVESCEGESSRAESDEDEEEN